jgi:hypothetical protein
MIMVDTSLRLSTTELGGLQQGVRNQTLEALREREAGEATAPQQAPVPSSQVSISDAGRAAVRVEAAANAAARPVDAVVPERGPATAGPASAVSAPEQAARPEASRSEPPRPDAATAAGREVVQRYLENAPRPAGQAAPAAVRVAA